MDNLAADEQKSGPSTSRKKHFAKSVLRSRPVSSTLSFMRSSDLAFLAKLHGTDKLAHGYIPRYHTLLRHLRRRRFNLLEIGIGGYEGYTVGGESLRMWKAYFPYAQIHGLDIADRSAVKESRITPWLGSQVDAELLRRIDSHAGGFEVIIDDGSHRSEHIIRSFQILFPLLKQGGVYFVEDVQTSYWPEYGGKAAAHDSSDQTTMGFFKNLADRLNVEEYKFDYPPSPFDGFVDSVSFWHNLIAVKKKGL